MKQQWLKLEELEAIQIDLPQNEPIPVFGDGEQIRDFTYIDDIVRVNQRLLETSDIDGYVMNVGSDHRITVNDLIARLREITGSASEVVYTDKQKGDAEHALADTSLARELVGYKPETTIEEGLKFYVMWHRRGVKQ